MKQELELVLFAHLVLFSLEEAVATPVPPARGWACISRGDWPLETAKVHVG